MKFKDLPPDKQIGQYIWNHQAHLGSGAYGKVYLGKDTKQNNKLVAIKVMENSQIADPYLQQALKNEIDILKTLKGDNVVGLLDYMQTKNRSYIVQMFCNQGDFRSYLTKKTKLPEPEAKYYKNVLSDLLTGFKELVDNNLVHRDLKPENILINDNVFKVADYGFGKHISNSKQILQTCCGTPLYMSPQILKNEQYTSKSDVWSMGLIYYEMLFGNTPWQCNSQYDLIKKTSTVPVKFPYGCKISQESQDFIKGCLQVNEAQRLSWEQVFNHPIYKKKAAELKYDKEIDVSKEIKEIIQQVQNVLEQKGINVEELFKKVDTSGNNKLDTTEFIVFMKMIHPDITEKEAESLFKTFDKDNSHFITIEEFKTFFLNTDYQEKKEDKNQMLNEYRVAKLVKKLVDVIIDNNINIDRLFKKFDASGDQNLNLEEFTKILKLIDESILNQEAACIFKKFDNDNSGTLSLKEFRKIVLEGVDEQGKNDPVKGSDNYKPMPNVPEEVQSLVRELKKIITVNSLDPLLIFKSFDKDSSGSMDVNEFGNLIRVVNARLTQQQVQLIFDAFDKNKDKNISIAEFQQVLQ